LNAGGLSGALLSNLVNFNLLVIGSPSGGPSELDGLDLLVEERASLASDEVVGPAILGNAAGTTSGNNFVLSV